MKLTRRLLGEQWLVGIKTAAGQGFIAVIEADKTASAVEAAQLAVSRPDLCELMAGNAFINATFPDVRGVVPVLKEGAQSLGLNADLLKPFGRDIRISGNSASDPYVVCTSDSDFFGVIMPLRGAAVTVPHWFQVRASEPDVTCAEAEAA